MQASRFPQTIMRRSAMLACACLLSSTLHAQSCAAPSFRLAPNSPGAPGGVQNVAVDGSPMQVLLYDFNHDGKIDLATANLGADDVTIALGNGDGTFTQASGSPVAMPSSPSTNGSRPDGLAAGNFNGDSNPDIAVALRNSGKLALLMGDGSGHFTLGTTVTAGPAGSTPDHIVVGDFNNDGKLDVAVSLSGIYVSGGIAVFLGDGAGNLTQAPGSPLVISGSKIEGIVAGHFTGPGHAPMDLAVTDGGHGQLLILQGAGNGSFTQFSAISVAAAGTAAQPHEVAAADVNSDGRMDLLVSNFASRANGGVPVQPGNDIAVLMQNTNGTFASPVHIAAGGDILSVASNDFNADGHPDLVSANAAFSFQGTVRFGDGTANFNGGGPTSYSAGGNPFNVATADLNNDGSPDFVVVNQPSNTLSVYLDNCLPGNHAPLANADAGVGFVTDKATAFNTASVLANDTDADSDALTVSNLDASGTLGAVAYVGNGTFHYDPNGAFAALGPLDSAIDTFRYTITDGHGTFATTTVTITVLGAQPADLTVSASALPSPLYAGGSSFQVPITVNNLSPNAASGVTLTLALSSSLSVVDPAMCTAISGGLSCNIGTLGGGQGTTTTITLAVPSSATGNAQILATVAGIQPDPISANNGTQMIAPIQLSADANISVTDNLAAITAGTMNSYTIVVGNAGPSDIAQAAVLANVPSGLLNAHWICSGTGGGTCGSSGSGNLNDAVSLPAGAQLTYMMQGTIDPAFAAATFALAANVVSAVADPNPANQSAADSDNVMLIGDASVSVDLTSSFVVMNHLSRYIVVVGNSGPSNLSGVQVGSGAPTGLNAVTWSCTVSGGASCGGSGNGALADTATLPPGASVRYSVTGIATSSQDYLNVNAMLSVPNGEQDSQPANNNASSAVPISLFRSGLESSELASTTTIAIDVQGDGAIALDRPTGGDAAILAQWRCAEIVCAYVVGAASKNGVIVTAWVRDADGRWLAHDWQYTSTNVHALWAALPDARVQIELVDDSGQTLAPY